MALVAPLVRETTTTTGTGNLTLAGVPDAVYQTFNTAFGLNRVFHYFIFDDTNNAWEDGEGYLTDSTTLVRAQILLSSNSNAAVNLGSGTKAVYCTFSTTKYIDNAALYAVQNFQAMR
jgi:hypothetical protein